MKRKGGGAIIYINNNLTYQTLILSSDEMCSLVGVYINELNLIVFVVYRPPPDYDTIYHGEILKNSFKKTVIDEINKVMDKYTAPVPDIVLTGDFNFPKAVWKQGIGEAKANSRSEKESLEEIIKLASNLNLLQKVNFSTRKARSGKGNILELIFTNNHDLITNMYSEKSKLSDHDYILCETSHDFNIKKEQLTEPEETNLSSYNYPKTNWELVKAKLRGTDWKNVINNCSSSVEMREAIIETSLKIMDEHGHKFKEQRGKKQQNIPKDRRTLHRKKKKLKEKLKRKNLTRNRIENIEKSISDIDTDLLLSHQNERVREEMCAISNIKVNPKHFFTYAKKHAKTKGGIGPFKINEDLITESNKMSEALSQQYVSSFSEPDMTNSIGDPKTFFSITEEPNVPLLTDITFTKEMLAKEIGNIKSNSAPGGDHYPVVLLQNCAEELSEPLYLLWRYSLDSGEIAPLFKNAIICPIQKPNTQRCHPKSYRPVSLTSHIIKVFERVLRTAIVKHLEDNNMLPKNQHGFISGRSTLSQLLHQVEQMIREWEDGKATDTIYLDFAKAFDKVDHNILCHKLKKLGITGKVGIWIREFLTGRVQQVAVNGVLSNPAQVLSGIPQGTVLGPILFIIMIDDLDCNLIHSLASKYADDTRVTASISKPEDAIQFQNELDNKVYPWAPANKMSLNGDKFEHLHVGNNLNQTKSSYKDPSGNIIEEKEHIKDLGVIISNDLTWSKQTEEVVAKARIMSAWALRTFSTRERDPMTTIWNAQIRPILDYCSPLWSPNPSNYGNIDLLESTQRSFTRRIIGTEDMDYAQRLKFLKMYSVQRRHERYKILYLYKIKEKMVPNISGTYGLQFYNSKRHGCMCRIPSYPLYHNKAVIARNASFALTASRLWNILPKYIRDLSGLKLIAFKRRLDKTLMLYPDEPRSSSSGRYTDSNGRVSNSLIDIGENVEIKRMLTQHCDGGLPRWPCSD